MKQWTIFLMLSLAGVSSCSQGNSQKDASPGQKVGGPCEGCEAIFESMSPFKDLSYVDTLPDYEEAGPKLEVRGVVYKSDGKTPAPGVVLYVYHTNQEGIYPKKGDEKGWARQHGYLRGWVKTNARGEYKFYTLRPGAYPGNDNPQHIHVTVKEPDINEYYIDDFHFSDDPILTAAMIRRFRNRGGDGVVKPVPNNGVQVVTRDIILGRNVPGYPVGNR